MKDQFGNDGYRNKELDRLDGVRDNNSMNRETNNPMANNERDPYSKDRGNVGTMERGTVTSPTDRTMDKRDSHTDITDRDRNRTDKDKALVGIFETESETINVVNRLKEIGYQEDEITVVAKDKDQMERLDDATDVNTDSENTAGGVGTGAAIGGTLGGIAAALPAFGLLAIPGIGPLLAAGPIAAIIGGVVAGGVAGGLVGGLVELGVREEDAKEYEHLIEQGKMLVLVENKENYRDDVQNTYRQNNSLVNDQDWNRR